MVGSEIQGVLLDLSGTLYSGEDRIEGTRRCLSILDERQIPYRFLTNTTTKSRSRIAVKLTELQIQFKEEWILTPLAAARERLKKDGFKTAALLMDDAVKGDLGGIAETQVDPDVVVIGDLGEGFTYSVLNQAFQLLAGGAATGASNLGVSFFWIWVPLLRP